MAHYRIVVFCTSCDRAHPTGATVYLRDGPPSKTSVAEAYKDKRLPPELAKLLKKDILCPELAISVTLADTNELYLVPID